jgi:Uma2 family endonuclease
MTVQPLPNMTVEEYLAFERASPTKHEYMAGTIRAMSGASVAHNIITVNIVATLHPQLRQRPCTVFPSDMRLGLVEKHMYVYPDVMVVCGELAFADNTRDTLVNLAVIIEVLSPSTEAYDRSKKAQYYRTIPSLQEYVLVGQDEPLIEHFVRYSAYQWLFSEIKDVKGQVRLVSIDCSLDLAEVYAKVFVNNG